MRFISSIFALFMMLSLSAQADMCYHEAIRNDSSFGLALSPDQAIKLCARSHDSGSPLTCYREAIRNDSAFAMGLSPEQAASYCRSN